MKKRNFFYIYLSTHIYLYTPHHQRCLIIFDEPFILTKNPHAIRRQVPLYNDIERIFPRAKSWGPPIYHTPRAKKSVYGIASVDRSQAEQTLLFYHSLFPRYLSNSSVGLPLYTIWHSAVLLIHLSFYSPPIYIYIHTQTIYFFFYHRHCCEKNYNTATIIFINISM